MGSRPAVQGRPLGPAASGRCLQEEPLSTSSEHLDQRVCSHSLREAPVSSCTDHSHPGIIPTRNFHLEQSSQE